MDVDKFRELFYYDDGVLRSKVNYYSWRVGKAVGHTHGNGIPRIKWDDHTYAINKISYFLVTDLWPRRLMHIDGDRTNNRVENLREY